VGGATGGGATGLGANGTCGGTGAWGAVGACGGGATGTTGVATAGVTAAVGANAAGSTTASGLTRRRFRARRVRGSDSTDGLVTSNGSLVAASAVARSGVAVSVLDVESLAFVELLPSDVDEEPELGSLLVVAVATKSVVWGLGSSAAGATTLGVAAASSDAGVESTTLVS
jgi:hypothetical protein